MNRNLKITIFGGTGFVGSYLAKFLKSLSFQCISLGSDDIDLCDYQSIKDFFDQHARPDLLINAAGRVGGIGFNNGANFDQFWVNAMIGTNVCRAVRDFGIKNVINLSSSCAYPTTEARPLSENSMYGRDFEPTNSGYALAKYQTSEALKLVAKETGAKTITLIPSNIYGPGDNFDIDNSHVLAAMIVKMHHAKQNGLDCKLWGDGTPVREFIHVEDFSRAVALIIAKWGEIDFLELNVGSGKSISIMRLANELAEIMGFSGNLIFDSTKPNGIFDKTMKIDRLESLGWSSSISLKSGIQQTYEYYANHYV